MDYTQLGRTGLSVSVIGLGGGGASRFGAGTGRSRGDSIRLIRHALDAGITLFDTSGTIGAVDPILAEALGHDRQRVIVSTKVAIAPSIGPFAKMRLAQRLAARAAGSFNLVASPRTIEQAVEHQLRVLNTDRIDILHLHSVLPGQYAAAAKRLLPVLRNLQDKGKIRAVGMTESFIRDRDHKALSKVVADNAADVIMVGFNLLNPSARHRVLARLASPAPGVMGMYAVRQALRSETTLQPVLSRLAQAGQLAPEHADAAALVRFLQDHDVPSLPNAAYRFCRHEPGIDTVLVGTGNPAHLDANIEAVLAPPLPHPVMDRLTTLFGALNGESGD